MRVIKKENTQGLKPAGNLDGCETLLQSISAKNYPRQELINCLLKYNKAIGNDDLALQNIARLKDGFCVITGQQAGLMGGPAYTILKAAGCLLLARELSAIPIFWLATEDHDIDEIDHSYLLDAAGNLQKTRLSLPKDGRMPEDLEITPPNAAILERFCRECGIADLIDSKEKSYALFHAKLLAKLFRGTGLVFIEPSRLRKLAKPFFKKEIEEAEAIKEILQKTGDAALRKGSNLFFKADGKYRRKILQNGNDFLIGRKKYEKEALLDLIEKEPEHFSPDVKARCVMQSLLFPTLAYVAGPNELNYYRQLREYHEFHGVFMPWIAPRMSATFINPKAARALDKFNLKPWEEIPGHYSGIYPEIEPLMEKFTGDLLKTAKNYLGNDVKQETANHYVGDMAKKFKRKLIVGRLKKEGLPSHSLHYLKNLFHPHDKPQERVFNWFEFQRFSSENLIKELLDKADWKFDGHHYCFLV